MPRPSSFCSKPIEGCSIHPKGAGDVHDRVTSVQPFDCLAPLMRRKRRNPGRAAARIKGRAAARIKTPAALRRQLGSVVHLANSLHRGSFDEGQGNGTRAPRHWRGSKTPNLRRSSTIPSRPSLNDPALA
jgi:hypothetical protein